MIIRYKIAILMLYYYLYVINNNIVIADAHPSNAI